MRQTLGEGLAPIVDLVYPPRCPSCGEGIGEHGGLCADCWIGLAIPTEPSCALCQRPFGDRGPGEGAACAPCMAAPPVHDGIAAGTLYTDTSRKLVLALKHGRRIALAPMLARLIAARLPEAESGGRLIVPVPLHRWRLWQRGFNQAALLARELGRSGQGELFVDGLKRVKRTPSLGGMGAKARARVLSGAITVPQPERIKGRDILLVDDVLTSGATSTACVKALKRAGAKSVVIACFARVLDEALEHAA
ncbi:ComF family protein [Qipengyuania xiapuensis]|uniref:ComF family protein n=2 Tax=Qipengyuania xiapuensis TaxID=2867236 RepID=A0ABX8ZXH7_9SPHN|nr:ComF family protein [Qipengyuania xiapuensis]QZD93725.1 ComF family protein [Qipengyuania xiapuensis]